MKAARFVIGLGNPGKLYQKTRHNFGFQVLDAWAQSEGRTWRKCSYAPALVVEVSSGQLLVKPQTFMNLSGEAVRKLVQWWKCKPAELLVVLDDIALPLGSMRLRAKGSSGGHNGLRSIEEALGSQEYPRLRLGLTRAQDVPGSDESCKQDLADFVLKNFTQEEESIVENVKKKAVVILKDCYTRGLEYGITQANQHL